MTMKDQAEAAQGQKQAWVQPAHRRCAHLPVSGEQCARTTRTGEKFCHTHQRFAETDPMYPIKVPLLEDPSSIRLVASQTVRALAMGTLPASNGRAMLSGCRMALDLLLFEFAKEKLRSRAQEDRAQEDRAQSAEHRAQEDRAQEDRAQSTEHRAQEDRAQEDRAQSTEHRAQEDRVQSAEHRAQENRAQEDRAQSTEHRAQEDRAQSTEHRAQEDGGPAMVEECGAECGNEEPLESHVCQNRADMGHAGEVRIVPRFPDLRQQWKAGVERSAQEVGRNLRRREEETGKEWMERQRGPIEAGHPEARGAAGRGDPSAEAREGVCGRDELPFDPQCPPSWDRERMKDWPPVHIAAWFRAVSPKSPQSEVREFVRAMWDLPRADERAGWPRPAASKDAMKTPPEDCLFWTMNAEEIAAWYRVQIPDMPERDARECAEQRVRRMEEVRGMRTKEASEAVGVA
ncbi:MAG TPA: hypothetical protein VMD92_07345 [Acidobacteriaceae bacterium]|nr:hypothetical protein [Acidobacteriaceae bacterium]